MQYMERIIWRGGKGGGGKGRGKDGRKGRGKDGRKGGGKGRGKEEVQEESGSFEDVKAEEQDDEALKPWAQRRRELRREKRRSGAVAWNEASEDESDWGTWSGLRRAGPQGGRLEEDWSNGKGRGKDGGKGELARDNRIKAAREAYNALRLKTRETLEEDKKQKEEAESKIKMLRAATAADREEVKRIRQWIAESKRAREEARLEAARKVREAAAAHGPSPARSPRNVAMSAQGQPSASAASVGRIAKMELQVQEVEEVAQTRRSSSTSSEIIRPKQNVNIRNGRKRRKQNVNSED